jgi:HAD superfamily hydrolase (TIGR01509 family)
MVVSSIDTIADDWQLALDGAVSALDAAGKALPPDELQRRRHALALERAETARDLAALAHDVGAHDVPWLSPTRVYPHALGLPDDLRACVLDLDGVLTDSNVLHAAAWAEVFDPLLVRLAERGDVPLVPFDPVADYSAFLDGRTRLEGIHLFLAGRGIRLAEGRPEDTADAQTAYGLARHKSQVLARHIHRRGINALPGARRYLEAAGRAGLGRAVVSSSARTLPMLELAGLAPLVDARVDAEQIAAGELRSRPAPDLLLRACELLGVAPQHAATIVHTADGVAAGRTSGLVVIGVGRTEPTRERLRRLGVEVVVDSLGALLDRRLLEPAARAA